MEVQHRKAISPVVSAVFLIVTAVVVSALYYFIYVRSPSGRGIKVESEINVGTNKCLVHVTLFNTGSVEFSSMKVKIEKSSPSVTVYGKYDAFATAVVTDTGRTLEIALQVSLPPGTMISGSLLSSCAWTRGSRYLVVVEAQDASGLTVTTASFARTP